MEKYESCSFFEIFNSAENNVRRRIQSAFNEFIDLVFFDILEKKDSPKIFTNLSLLKSEILMFRKYLDLNSKDGKLKQDYIDKALVFIDSQMKLIEWEMTSGYSPRISAPQKTKYGIFQWTLNLADLVELGYGLATSKAINHGDTEVKDLILYLAEIFNVPIKNPYATYRDIRKRTGKSRTTFLDEMARLLNRRMDDADNGITPKKK